MPSNLLEVYSLLLLISLGGFMLSVGFIIYYSTTNNYDKTELWIKVMVVCWIAILTGALFGKGD